jgi:uncharacterized protein (DUF1501 family)
MVGDTIMLRLEENHGLRSCDGVTRREFLRVGGLALGLSLTELTKLHGAHSGTAKACIQLFLVGGPSQLETWDPKPNAPAEIRGLFRPIQTNVPGIHIAEHLPLMAERADRYAIVRSVYHKEAPIHETGQQLLQTGRTSRDGIDWPHCGAVLSRLSPSATVPTWAVVPSRIHHTGVRIDNGQSAGFLGAEHEPVVCTSDSLDPSQRVFDLDVEPNVVRSRYGWNTFGQSCLLARRLVQHGVRLVTVNMFDTVFNKVTWDCHANGGDLNSTLDDYRTTLCPMFDLAYAALLDDLQEMGMLDETLVVSMGEFGRTPKINTGGGRDHWPGVWSVVLAGGGVRGGQVIGASDRHAEEPRDRPIQAAEIVATVLYALGVDPACRLPQPDGRFLPPVEAKPVLELF